ncbi:MAG: OmpA family protein [Alphaproteobacteria bacterium]|nr:OmpA family protein [Alphaproteobacteria bacterium]
MKSLFKCGSFFASIGLLLLSGCGVMDDDSDINSSDSGIVVEDEALRNAAIDFIANAGDRVFFPYDSSTLTQDARNILSRQAQWLRNHTDRRVLIEGHCDERGTREYNLGLGERRADAAARYLTEQGISGDRVRTISYGKDKPIAVQGSSDEINRINRVAIAVIE